MTRWRLAGLSVAAVLLARSVPVAAVVGASQDADGFADRVVMVLQRRGAVAGFCSGVVVAPDAVLTAAHCVPPGSDLRIHFRDADGEPVLLPVKAVTRHPGYRPDAIAKREMSVDLAVVLLAAALPARFHPATIASLDGAAAAGDAFRVVGYGVTREAAGASSGRLRAVDLVARAPLSRVLLWAEDPHQRGAGACTGDSGGPVLQGSGSGVVALTLWASGEGRAHCGSLTQALWLGPYRDWISTSIAP